MKLPTSLSELKRLNAKTDATESSDEHETEVLEADEHDQTENLEALTDGDEDEGEEEQSVPAWMQSGDDANEDESDVQVPLKAHIAQRKKFQGNIHSLRSDIEERDTQIEALTETVKELKSALSPQTIPKGGSSDIELPPVLSDFQDEDNPEGAHQSALLEWSMRSFEKRQRQSEAKRQADQAAAMREEELNAHYTRAAILVEAGQLTPEEYRTADAYVRQAVENTRPGEGRTIFNTLFADLGKGSEKVLISLYRNNTNLSRLQQELKRDMSGLRAATYLGRLAAEFEREGSKTAISSAPRPGTKIKGGGKRTAADKNAQQLKKEYDKAHKDNDFGAAFAAKRKARAAGVDVSRWAYE